MTGYIGLTLKCGGFTSLDKVYLQNTLEQSMDEQKLSFITPPPSVISAYFTGMYQKQSPEATTDYCFELSKELHSLNANPSFDEYKPFIRLNLSGKSCGFTYGNDREVARVLSEKNEALAAGVLFELAQVFPQCKVYAGEGHIKMSKMDFDEEVFEDLAPQESLLSHVLRLKGSMVKLRSPNHGGLVELLTHYKGQVYYIFDQREFIAYVEVQ